jgi:hypothetical protein
MKVGMGWLGWSEEQTLATDIQSIEIAYRGCHERLCAVAGKSIPGAKIEETASGVVMTTDLFRAMFGKSK